MFGRNSRLSTIPEMFSSVCLFDVWHDVRSVFQAGASRNWIYQHIQDMITSHIDRVNPRLLALITIDRMLIAYTLHSQTAVATTARLVTNVIILLNECIITLEAEPNGLHTWMPNFILDLHRQNPALILAAREYIAAIDRGIPRWPIEYTTVMDRVNRIVREEEGSRLAMAMMFHRRLGAASPHMPVDLVINHVFTPAFPDLAQFVPQYHTDIVSDIDSSSSDDDE